MQQAFRVSSVQFRSQQSDQPVQRVGMATPFTAEQMAWFEAAFSARPPLPSSTSSGPSAGTSGEAGGRVSAPRTIPEAGSSGATPLTGSVLPPATQSSSGTCLPLITSIMCQLGRGLPVIDTRGITGGVEPRMAPGGRTGPAPPAPPPPLLIAPPQRAA